MLTYTALLFILSGNTLAARPKIPLVPLLKTGARAWVNARTIPETGRVGGGINRLQLHAVSDGTNVAYIAEVKRFLKMLRKLEVRPSTMSEWDLYMADELSRRCYTRDCSLSSSQYLFHGFCHPFPEHKHRLPESARALKGWERQVGSRLGGPMTWGVVLLIIQHMFLEGQVWAGLWVWLQHDVYGGEQDMEILHEPDIYHAPPSECALQFGPRERGESVKTGSDQGCEVDDPLLSRILYAVKRKILSAGAPLFPHTQAFVRKIWAQTQETLQLDRVHPLHSLRHTKPSADARSKRRTLEEIRRRGRWNQLKSVQRYSRGHAVTMHLAALPGPARLSAEAAVAQYPRCLAVALRNGPAAKTPLAKIILEVIESA